MKIKFETRQKDGVYTLVATAYAAPHEQAGFGIEPTPEAQSVGEVTYRLKAHLKVTEEIKEKMKALLEASL